MSPPEYANLVVTHRILYMFHVDNIPTTDVAENLTAESMATLPPFGPLEGHKWFDWIFSQ
jgi:hypothetical protein